MNRQTSIRQETRIFESEAKLNIKRAIEELEGTFNHDHDTTDVREQPRQALSMRENMVSNLPVVHEEEGAGQKSFKTLEFLGEEESTRSVITSAPRLKDIAQRIRLIQRVSTQRTKTRIGGTFEEGKQQRDLTNANRQDLENQSPSRGPGADGGKTGKHFGRKQSVLGAMFNQNNNTPTGHTGESGKMEDDYELHLINDGILLDSGRQRPCCSSLIKFVSFFKIKKKTFRYFLRAVFYGIIPLIGVAASLFYFIGNPIGPLNASYSWWFLLLARFGTTFICAQFCQYLFIDVIALETQLTVILLSRVFTLIAMQAKGWPILLMFWSILNFSLLYGTG